MTKKRNRKGFDICELNNLNTPCQQIHYPICKYMYSKNKAIVIDNDDPKKAIFARNNYNNLNNTLNEIISTKPMFFCINDDENDVNKREEVRNIVLNFFKTYYPNIPNYEK